MGSRRAPIAHREDSDS